MPKLLTSDEVELYYSTEGVGSPIVFLAGWAMDSSWWKHQLPLASEYQIVVLDPRAQGRSSQVTRGIRLGRQAMDLRELLDELQLQDVTLVGWSRSASIALAYWELFGSHRLGRLVFVGITPCISKRPDWEWGYSMDPVEFQKQILADHEGVVRGVVEALFYLSPSSEAMEEMVRTTMLSPALAGARMLEDHGVIDWRDMLETISLPTLVCVGRHDRNAPLPAAEYVHRSVRDSRLIVFEKSAHVPFYEEPNRFNDELVEFIDASRSPLAPYI